MNEDFGYGLLSFSTKFSYIYGVDKENPNLREYIGPVEMKLSYGQIIPVIDRYSELSVRVFPGSSLSKGGQEVGLSVQFGFLPVTSSLYLQYYNGYAESLLNYDKHLSVWRVGVVLR